ncbi:MAG TPA: MMPL family transporter [Streptosporangiaceae bacterium]|nr:MMPL family transporter [Streptosporangiaceae bacterium]
MPGSSTALRPGGPPRTLRPGILGTLGRACFRHRWLIVVSWLVLVACLITLWTRFGAPAQDNFTGSDPGQTLLNQHFHRQSGDTLTLAIRSAGPVSSPAVRAQVTGALVPFAHAAHVTAVGSPYQVPGQVSADGHIAFATIQFDVPGSSISNAEALALMHDARAASGHGVTFALGGDAVDQAETPYGGPTEGVGVLAAAIVLLIAFGSLLAMGLPVITAVLGIGAGLSLIALLGHIAPAPSFSPIVASMIGLGVGVDYALFIVTRFREGLRGGRPPEDAAVLAMRTAGRTVLVAGTTVIIGMLGLLVLREPLMNGVAVAAAATVAMVLLGSLTLLPALLGFTGTRLARPSRLRLPRWLGGRPAGDGLTASRPAAERWAEMIQRRPAVAAVLSAGLILALAAPALGMKLSMPDESSQARGTVGYASYATMAQGFGPGFDAPLIVAAALPAPTASTAGLRAAIAATPGIARVTPAQISHDGQAAMMIAYPVTGEQDAATNTLVNQLRGQVLPRATAGTGIRAYLTGPNAANVSFANLFGQRLPWLIGVVVALSMVLLLVMFRSVTVAVKAALMNLLSISAAYGVLVLIAQDGWLGRLFGFPEKMPVTTWVPMFLFVILFGLSMDYEVFLLSRIRESYDATGDNAASVATGLARTARVITAAAAIMVVVFLSFVLGANVSVKQVGLGLAVAVLIDATVVRMVLVPAVMELLGKANWWLPRPLARILPATALTEAGPGAADTPVPVPGDSRLPAPATR